MTITEKKSQSLSKQEILNGNDGKLLSEDDYVWYLGYGSNMCEKVFQGRRKAKPLESFACKVPNYFLSFDMFGFSYFEPAYASIYPHTLNTPTYEYAKNVHDHCCPGLPFKFDPNEPEKYLPPTLNGVLYLISKEDYKRILYTEGGWGYDDLENGYDTIDVECITYDNKKIIAKTLKGKPASIEAGCQPSLRYLNLIRTGAKENNISPAYQDYLNSLKHFEATTTSRKIGRVLFLISSIPIVLFTLILSSFALRRDRVPKLAARMFVYVVIISKANHDFFFKPFFGSGFNNDEQLKEG